MDESRQRYYDPRIDGLRFLAFLAVFVAHALPGYEQAFSRFLHLSPALAALLAAAIRSGVFGVDLFFCLSAYLITRLLLREVALRGQLDVMAFYVRRTLRIWPLYFGFLILTLTVLDPLIPGHGLKGSFASAYFLFAANWACALHALPLSVAAPLWSVSIEEQFYLAWPLLVRWASPARLLRLSIILLVIASISRLLLTLLSARHPALWCNTLARLDPIALGAILALVHEERRLPRLRLPRVLLLAAAPIVWTVVARLSVVETAPSWHAMWGYPLVALGAVALISAATEPTGLRSRWLALRPLVYLGKISYGLYVFHLFAIRLTEHHVKLGGSRLVEAAARVSLSFLLTVAMAALSYRFLEQPFLRWKSRFARVESRPV